MPDSSTPSQVPTPNASSDTGLSSRRAAWRWVPSLYFAEGIPLVVVLIVSVIMYKRLGVSNADITLYTGWLYLPWVIKPFWCPLVEIVKTKRWWIVAMQLLIGAGLAGVALTIPTHDFFRYTLAFMWLMAFSSATHDIAADGFYMLSLSSNNQTWFVGIRSTFYRLAMISGQGLLVILAGQLESATGLPDVTVEVRAVAQGKTFQAFQPDDVNTPVVQGPLHITVQQPAVDITLSPRSEKDINALVAKAKQWNIHHGFTAKVKSAEKSKKKSDRFAQLEDWIRNNFGPEEIEVGDKSVGNVGIVYITLAGAIEADEEVIIQFARTSGDKNIKIIEGERFVVTPTNQGVPMASVVQLDAYLDHNTDAVFSAQSGNTRFAWATSFYCLAGLFLAFFAYHTFTLPQPAADATEGAGRGSDLFAEFFQTFVSFFRKKQIVAVLCFMLFYRFAESQLLKVAQLFLIDTELEGGLALTTSEIGFVYGTVGVLMLTVGGILGGIVASRRGLKSWIGWMVLAINLPNAVYVFLSIVRPESFFVVNCAVAVEQFGYGFGFTAYMLFMLYVAQGEHETAHFAICTGFMALGNMVPAMWSGWLQELIGYEHFFIWILIATLPSFLVVWWVKIDPSFGKKSVEGE